MSKELQISIGPEPDGWMRIDAAVEEFAGEQGWPPDLDFQVRMFLEELVLNVLNHGDISGEAGLQLKVESSESQVAICLSDNGPEFNPLRDASGPDLESGIDDRPIGGLGIHLVKSMSDGVTYERSGGWNHLRILKNRTR